MTVTKFFDMCSGGDAKTEFEVIFIEGDEDTATGIFQRKFGRDPYNVTCQCCGPDFAVDEYDTFEEASSYVIKHGMSFAYYPRR